RARISARWVSGAAMSPTTIAIAITTPIDAPSTSETTAIARNATPMSTAACTSTDRGDRGGNDEGVSLAGTERAYRRVGVGSRAAGIRRSVHLGIPEALTLAAARGP